MVDLRLGPYTCLKPAYAYCHLLYMCCGTFKISFLSNHRKHYKHLADTNASDLVQ
jgi:hypothetical protein